MRRGERNRSWSFGVIGASSSFAGRFGVLSLLLAACGQSIHRENGVNGSAGASSSGGGNSGDCSAPVSIDSLIAGAPVELPTRLEGNLCDAEDALSLVFVDDPAERVIGAELAQGSGEYQLALFHAELETGAPVRALVPLPTEPQALTLSASSPSIFFGVRANGLDDDRIIVKLSGSPGHVALDLARPELEPFLDCQGAYESLPVATPPHELPVLLHTSLCHARDSRVWAIEVAAGRPVTITLENPEAIETFDLALYEDNDDYQAIAVSAGVTRAKLGLLAARSLSFTPVNAGIVGLYAALGDSRGDGIELRIEQP